MSDRTSQIFEYDDSHVIRVLSAAKIRENIPESSLSDIELIKRLIAQSKRCFKQLHSIAGVNVVEHDVIEIESTPLVKLITKVTKVNGSSLFVLDLEDSIKLDLVIKLLDGLLEYVTAVVKGEYDFLWIDLSLRQFMFGSTSEDSEERIYLTDIDPLIVPHNNETQDVLVHRLQNMYSSIVAQYKNSDTSRLVSLSSELPKASKAFDPEKIQFKYGIV